MHSIANALREYSSTVGIPSPAFHVQVHAIHLLQLFCLNAQIVDHVDEANLKSVQNKVWADAEAFSLELEWELSRISHHLMSLALRLEHLAAILATVSELADNRELDTAMRTLCTRLRVRCSLTSSDSPNANSIHSVLELVLGWIQWRVDRLLYIRRTHPL